MTNKASDTVFVPIKLAEKLWPDIVTEIKTAKEETSKPEFMSEITGIRAQICIYNDGAVKMMPLQIVYSNSIEIPVAETLATIITIRPFSVWMEGT